MSDKRSMEVSAIPEIGASNVNDNLVGRRSIPNANVQEIVFWEDQNPKSLINLVTPKLRELMRELPPSLLALSEKEIRRKLDPSWIQDQLRLAFWDEYFLTVDNNFKSMRPAAMYAQVCSKETFYTVVENPLFLAYLTKPPGGYVLKMRSLLEMAMERMRDVLQLPLENPDGSVNTKLIAEIVKIAAITDNRVKGAVTQKIQIDQTTKSLHVNATYEPPKSHQDMEKELKQIENEILKIRGPTLNPGAGMHGQEGDTTGGASTSDGDFIEVRATQAEEERA